MRRLMLVCASLIVLLAALCLPSQGQQQAFKLAGTVVNSATGDPIRGALVQVFGSTSRTASTGTDGRFEFDGLPSGSFAIVAQRPGFDSENTQRQVTLAADTTSFSVKLEPLARISGSIVDREGDPIDGVTVQCMRSVVANGHRSWQRFQGRSTDEAGHFSLEDLTPGVYVVYTSEMQLYRAAAVKSEAARFVYPQTFYPDAPSRDAAQLIQLRPGEEARADITLHSMRANSVAFTTDPAYGNVIATIGSGNSDDEEQFGGRAAVVSDRGVLTFPAVPQGSWKITVRGPFSGMRKQNEEPLYGELPIEVAGSDLENLVVPMSKLPDIQVTISGGTANGLFLQLFSKTGQGYGSEDQNGVVRFRSIQPGSYRVSWQPPDVCIAAITSGALDLLHNELVIAAGASVPPISVQRADNCGSITINTQNGARGLAVVTSNSKALEPRVFGLNGSSLEVKNLPEGEYTVFAFDDVNNLEYSNPDSMLSFKSQVVKVEPGQSATVQVDINQRHPE